MGWVAATSQTFVGNNSRALAVSAFQLGIANSSPPPKTTLQQYLESLGNLLNLSPVFFPLFRAAQGWEGLSFPRKRPLASPSLLSMVPVSHVNLRCRR